LNSSPYDGEDILSSSYDSGFGKKMEFEGLDFETRLKMPSSDDLIISEALL
jgi:hypothetical protein